MDIETEGTTIINDTVSEFSDDYSRLRAKLFELRLLQTRGGTDMSKEDLNCQIEKVRKDLAKLMAAARKKEIEIKEINEGGLKK